MNSNMQRTGCIVYKLEDATEHRVLVIIRKRLGAALIVTYGTGRCNVQDTHTYIHTLESVSTH